MNAISFTVPSVYFSRIEMNVTIIYMRIKREVETLSSNLFCIALRIADTRVSSLGNSCMITYSSIYKKQLRVSSDRV